MSLSTWIMKLATGRPPEGRKDWAMAMQAEYEALGQGRLGWALGCLATTTGWRLRTDAVYLLAIFIAVILIKSVINDLFSWIPVKFAPEIYDTPIFGIHLGVYLWNALPFISLCFALGVWRPDRAVLTGIVATIISIAYSYIWFWTYMDMPFGGYINFNDLPPVIGETVILIGCITSAMAGAWMRKGFRRVA